jgi:hypothetical protein
MRTFFAWFDKHGLTLLSAFLLIFIPLYPKLPMFDIIPGYIVRVRLEDFFILFTLGFWVVQLIRKKVTLHPLMTKLILAYLAIGLLSSLSAVFITQTVPMSDIHIAKLALHFIRRIQYFSLFFVFFSTIKSFKQVKIYMAILGVTLLAVSLYGYGQKYLYWPVYSTMNREFSKGWKLYLTEHARVPSTFGGHYDAAAFTMMVITIALAVLWFAKDRRVQAAAAIIYVIGFWLLILTASRTSFIAYLGAISLLAFISMFVKKWWWPIPRYILAMSFSLFVMLSFGDLSERFSQVLGLERIKTEFSDLFLSAKVDKPSDGISTDDLARVTTPTDTPPSTQKPGLPGDVYEDIPLQVAERDEFGRLTGNYDMVSRTYSDNAYRFGLSAAIRLDALWPRAIEGFKINPLLGSGYSTLTKETVGQFTEAESTDNDFLRALGETGLLGFLSFFAVVTAGIVIAIKSIKKVTDPLIQSFLVGYVAAAVGLLLNAIYIDVFEASKVALMYWAMTGMVVAISVVNQAKSAPESAKKSKKSKK